jgi:hypothetical protein
MLCNAPLQYGLRILLRGRGIYRNYEGRKEVTTQEKATGDDYRICEGDIKLMPFELKADQSTP